jgi:hypothetical protein
VVTYVQRNALWIVLCYWIAASVVISLINPGSTLLLPSVELVVAWLAGVPLYVALRNWPRPG